MPLLPIVTAAGGAVVLSLDVDGTRTAVGWQLQNGLTVPVSVTLVSGPHNIRQDFAPGVHAGAIQRNRQWNVDADTCAATYSVTVTWGG